IHPGRDGQVTTHIPSSSLSNITFISIFSSPPDRILTSYQNKINLKVTSFLQRWHKNIIKGI
ncbi:MAG: hypothetical protein ABII90_11805, partial [Bacteroidota bacterium]